ncbi:RICIN domain-containing protein [Streptomyces lonarensis]|uniref:Chitinase n=1 Tax=Streptomyces lonarensis TaxID=700599 RepID=A0A7X6HYI5_9ACTN|nr:RICIN domain-containing protein [Streptomyces lonarensis]NJQ05249.1 chitinase [Streptomyces lonarensis]
MHARLTAATAWCAALALSLLTAPAAAALGGPSTLDRPGSGATTPALTGSLFVQNVADGNQLSASGSWVTTNRPRGDEDRQQWELRESPNGGHTLRSVGAADVCLTEENASGADARLSVGTCSGPRTEWLVQEQADGRHRIEARGSGRVLVGGEGHGATARAVAAAGSGPRQEWHLTPVSPPRAPMPATPRLDEVTFLTTHNAMHNTEDQPGFLVAPNQPHDVAAQLRAGAHALMLDAHHAAGRLRLCHDIPVVGNCSRARPAADFFADIGAFLAEDRDAVVTVFLEDYSTAEQLRTELAGQLGAGSALADRVFRPDAAGVREHGWPTLAELRRTDQRLLLFTSDTAASARSNGKNALGFMSQRDWTVENYWSMGGGLGTGDWSCYSRWDDIPLSREEDGFRRLFVMNHFRDVPMAPTYRTDNEKLQNRAERFCMPAARKKPNYLAIDQYKDGNPMAAVDALNRYTY